MGNQSSTTTTTTTTNSGHGSGGEPEELSGCPVMHNKKQQQQQESACPVAGDNKQKQHPHVYNVYGQRIDPTNQMPSQPNQESHPEQVKPLPKQRIESTIRKGGTENTWVYPSEQMFYNALKRKGKANGITEDDMEMLVAIHNGTNERAWKMVLDWEKKYHACADPTLIRFQGKPHDLSPQARFKTMVMGYPQPFDRHDWFVDRCGQQVRYVLDFYYDKSNEDGEMVITKNEEGFLVPKRVIIDVRPALDSFENATDRLKNLFRPNADI
jgi:cytochrome c heme-lyase